MGKQIVVNNKKELQKQFRQARAKKYGNYTVHKNFNGIKTKFDSKAEYQRFLYLKNLEENGIITELKMQTKFLLQEKYTNAKKEKIQAINYKADFTYKKDGKWIVEDVKGFITNEFKLKKKMFEFKYPELTIDIIKN